MCTPLIALRIFPAILLLTAGMHPEVRLATRTAFTRLFRIVAGSGVGGLAGTKDGKKVDDARTRTVIQCMCFFQQYPNISRPSVESLNRFIADAFPSSLDVVDSGRETCNSLTQRNMLRCSPGSKAAANAQRSDESYNTP